MSAEIGEPGAAAESAARVAAVILNYRTPELALDCLDSLLPELGADDLAVLVDNASGDGSAEKLRAAVAERGYGVRLVETARNGGFAAGNNAGIGAVRARAYLLLNSDTLVRRGAVEALWSALAADSGVGLASPRLEWPDGTPQQSCFRDHTPFSELIAGSGTGPVRRLLGRFEVALPVAERAFGPPWTSFAAVMIRREALAALGPLDEGYFMYYEDADYCRRARRAGWGVWHEPRARVVHLRGGTSPVKALTAAGRRRPRYYYAARARYFRKAYGRAGLLAANALWTLGRSIAWLRETFGRKRPHTVERELLDTWKA